jgi:predicted CXXCH cytochrome family protein
LRESIRYNTSIMKPVFLTIAVAVLWASCAFAAEALPPVKKDCFLCHELNEKGTMVGLKKPINELCLQCHPDRSAPNEHAVGVTPPFSVENLPLYSGKVTCASCHEPHGLTGISKMLRAKPRDLCLYCHKK